MSSDMIILNQRISKMQNYATSKQIALSLILKLKMFLMTLQIMLKKNFIHQIMQSRDRCLHAGKNKKAIGLMKDELGGKTMTEFVAVRRNTYSYLIDDGNSNTKAKGTKKMCNKIYKYINIK